MRFIITRLITIATCILSAALQAQESSAPETASNANGAPASNFPDLTKRGSNQVKQAISEFLDEYGLVIGENPNGLWVQVGTATVKSLGGSKTFGDDRRAAFTEARLDAQANLIRSLGIKSQTITIQRVFSDDSVDDPAYENLEESQDRLSRKIEQITEASIDQALRDLGEEPSPEVTLTQKRDLYRKTLSQVSLQKAANSVGGFFVMTTIEANDGNEPGRVSVGVIIGRHPNSLGWISDIAKGGGAGVPRGEPGAPISERIVKDPAWLFDKFGVRAVYGAEGEVILIAYGQDSPSITRADSDSRISRAIGISEKRAYADAVRALEQFLDSTLAWQGRDESGSDERETMLTTSLEGSEVARTEDIVNRVKVYEESAKAWSSSFVRGANLYHSWQGNHPEFGNPLVGCVLVWTPASAAAAGRFNRPTTPNNDPGFTPRAPTPGVRRSQGEDIPKGTRGSGGQSDTATNNEVSSGSECDGVEAVGIGSGREEAVLNALENAVRQACGVAVQSSVESGDRSENSIIDVRINEACSEMRSTFTSASLLKQDVSVRTKGLVHSYRVLSEERDPTNNKVRLSICAQIPEFDPKNPRPGSKPTLIVLKPTYRQSGFDVFGSPVSGQDVARSLETELARDIFKTRAFTLLERERLAAILGEQAFIASDLSAIREKAKLGILSGGDLVLISEIEDLVAAQEEKLIKLTGNRIVRRYGSAKVNWRVVSVGTGEVIDQDSVSIPLDDAGFRQMTATFPAAPVQAAFMATASSRIAPALAARLAPVRVAQVVGGTVFLNRGSDTLRSGQSFDVYRQGAEMTDPNTGAALGRTEAHVGVLRVDRCETDFSTAVIVSGTVGPLDAGAVCRARS